MTTPLSMDIMSEMGRPTGMDMGYSVFVMRDSSAEGNAAPKVFLGGRGDTTTPTSGSIQATRCMCFG